MLARRRVFAQIGLFEPQFRSGEFISWYLRCRSQGVSEAMLPDRVLRRRLHDRNHGTVRRDTRVDYARVLRAHLQRRQSPT